MDQGQRALCREVSEARAEAHEENHPNIVPEAEQHVFSIDTRDREATELENYPLERVVTRPEPEAGRFAHFKHELHLLSQNAKVDPHCCRDHLANERTFLGWIRTSISLAIMGVVIAQLFRLQHSPSPNPIFGFYKLGIPLACACHGSALIIVLLGAHRFRKQQNNMILGWVQAGGWEPMVVGALITLVLTSIFVLVIAVDIDKELS